MNGELAWVPENSWLGRRDSEDTGSPGLTLLILQTLWRAPWLHSLDVFSHAMNIFK